MALRAKALWPVHLSSARSAKKCLPSLCETLWHTLCNSVSDGYLLDCFLAYLLRRPAAIRDEFAAERTHDAYSRSRFVDCWASP